MQQKKIVEGHEYIIEHDAVQSKYGWYLGKIDRETYVKEIRKESNVVVVTAKGVERYTESDNAINAMRNDGIRVRVSDVLWNAMRESQEDKELFDSRVEREFVVHARKVIETKRDRDKRVAQEKADERKREALRNQTLRDKAQGIEPEDIGEIIEDAERQAGKSSIDVVDRLRSLAESATTLADSIDESVEGSRWSAQLKEDYDVWPTVGNYDIQSVTNSYRRVIEEVRDYSVAAHTANTFRLVKQNKERS